MNRLLLLPLLACVAFASPEVINDVELRAKFERELGKFSTDDGYPSGEELAEKADQVPKQTSLPAGAKTVDKSTGHPADAVYMLSSVYKCGRCDKWHLAGVATAWALSRDGLMLSNHHVFQKAKGGVMGVCDRHGKVWPITEILAADPATDTALFRVDADDLLPLALGTPAEVGAEVEVISHPSGRFFMHTYGRVSRYFERPAQGDQLPKFRMSITADYAKGSSGGPVLDADDRVVGMVASTQSIYYKSNNGEPKGPLQMVVKNCVPVASIHALIGAEEETAATSQR